MMQAWNELTAFWASAQQNSVCLALALAAAVFCLVYGSRQGLGLRRVAAGFLGIWLFFYNPFIVFAYEQICKKAYPFHALYIGLPFLPFLAVTGAVLITRNSRSGRDKLVLAAGVIVAVFLSGNLMPSAFAEEISPSGSDMTKMTDIIMDVSGQEENLLQAIRNAAEELRESGAEPLLTAPKEIMEDIRRLDGRIALAYGRDLWQTEVLTYLHETYDEGQIILCQMMESRETETTETAEYAITLGCNLLVFRDVLDAAFVQSHHLRLYGEGQGLYFYVLH